MIRIRVIVAVKKLGNFLLLVIRSKRICGDVLDSKRFLLETPDQRIYILRIVYPRPQPQKVTSRNKLARHFSMRRRQRLKHSEELFVSDRPGQQRNYKCKAKDNAFPEAIYQAPAKRSASKKHCENKREPDTEYEEARVWPKQ